MDMDWEDFSILSDAGYLYPRLSEKRRALLISALAYLEDRANWPGISDADWDVVEAELAGISYDFDSALEKCDSVG